MQNKTKYCLPIQAKTVEEIAEKISKEADIIEIWLDHLKEIDFAKLKSLRRNVGKPFLYVCKGKREKGLFRGTEKERIEVLINATSCGDYIDVDIRTDKALIKKLALSAKKLIISYHNFEKTPKNLVRTYDKMRGLKPDVIKFSTKINKSNDIGELFKLIIKAEADNQPIITLGMGEKGKITRILAPQAGNYLYYAPLNKEEATAPGQIVYDELQGYWQ